MILPVQFIGPTFPDGYCPANIQQYSNDYTAGLQLSSTFTLDTIVVSDTAPADTTKLWFKTLNGAPFSLPTPLPLYKWHQVLATWVAAHRDPEGWNSWQVVETEADIWSLEGGDGSNPATTPPTATTGSFWQLDPRLSGRSPMSPGAIPSANPAKTLGYKEAFGEGAHLMTAQEIGPHTHPLNADASIKNGDNIKVVTSGSGTAGLLIGASGSATTPDLSVQNPTYTAGQQSMPVVHPVYGMACLIRTARLYYVG